MVLQVPTILKRFAREAEQASVPMVRMLIGEARISVSQVTGLATVATTGSYNDLLDLPSGAAVAAGTATLDFGSYGGDAAVVVTGQSGILAGSSVVATVAAVDTAENLAEEVAVDPPLVVAGGIIPGTGFTIYGRVVEGGLHGRINVNWLWR